MKKLTLTHKAAGVSSRAIRLMESALQSEVARMQSVVVNGGYGDERAAVNLCSDQKMLAHVNRVVKSKKKLKPTYLVVVGIGGSNLGTIAVQEAVLGRLHNQRTSKTKVLYVDTVDADSLHDSLELVERALKRRENVLVNAISKSGGTTETVANTQLFIDLLKRYKKKNHHEYVVFTSNKDSKMWKLGEKRAYTTLEIPFLVGGRYSVLSPVGLFPLGLLGIDIDELVSGALAMQKRCVMSSTKKNPALLSAILLHLHHKHGESIHDMFLFSNDLESLGKWYRQLIAESLGKEYNKKHQQVFAGITPVVSVGSTDLHSVAQLDLGGPFDKYTTFVDVKNMNHSLKIPRDRAFNALVADIQGKYVSDIMNAILKGVRIAYRKNKRHYQYIQLPDKSAHSIGEFLQMQMMKIMYLGVLMGVNPFDQPNVESYKKETKKILSHS